MSRNLAQVRGITGYFIDTLPYWRCSNNYIFGKLFFKISVTNLASVVQMIKMFVSIRRRNNFYNIEKVLYLNGFLLVFGSWSAVGNCAHYFFSDNFGRISQENSIAFTFRFTHFAFAVKSGYFYQVLTKIKGIR